jgi:hypothetical protein
MVGETAKRGPFLALLVMLMILLHITLCGAATSIMKDNDTYPYHARMDEPEFLFDSEIGRMLINKNDPIYATNSAGRQAVPCPQGERYGKCLPLGNGLNPARQKCDKYQRNVNDCPK